MKSSQKQPAEHSIFVFLSFAVAGGFLEAYTYLLHGGVFCNAQTGNLVLLALNLLSADFSAASRYLFSILAYIAGILVSALLPALLKGKCFHLAVTAFEILALAAIAFIPSYASDWFTYVSVAFLCALQYNTFTECRGAKLATTFCTNNIRQTILHLHAGIRDKNSALLQKSGIYALVIAVFALGAVLGGLTGKYLGNYSALVCAAALVPAFFYLLSDELHRAKNQPLPPQQSEISDAEKSNIA